MWRQARQEELDLGKAKAIRHMLTYFFLKLYYFFFFTPIEITGVQIAGELANLLIVFFTIAKYAELRTLSYFIRVSTVNGKRTGPQKICAN